MIGQRLSHYTIVEQIGAGGMGVVFRAHDEQLDRDVAIKVLPSGSLADENARKRFRKEALSLARLNHPNIATVHEFGSEHGVDFLVTEYIVGITLDAKLASGLLPSDEVISLGLQLAAGLAAAHVQGVVHRDLKPGNLRITTDGRLKILDFGLAQFMPRASEMGATVTMSQSQETSGTMPYMSPEQLRGEVADARSDVWAAGAVLYEMATAQRPFPQSVPALLINAILNQRPERPGKIAPMPAGLETVILKALERDPSQRYQSAEELGRDLAHPPGPSVAAAKTASNRPLLAGLIATAALVCVFAIIGYVLLHHRATQTSAPSAISRRRSIAVLGFKNLSGTADKSWLSTALSEMLTTELSQGDQLRTIPGESVALMKASLSLPDADSFSQQTLTRIRQNLGSDDVVLGSYLTLGNGLLRLDVRLQDAVAGEILATISEKGSESEIDNLVGKAGAELRSKLGIGELSDAQSAEVRASLPSNPEAARLYSIGLQKLRLFDAVSARASLEKAIELAPEHAPTHSALAEALSLLGYQSKAQEQAKRALELSEQSSGISREEKLLIEGQAHQLLAERPQAVESFQALSKFFPDNTDYGLFLIRAQIADGHPPDAETTLAGMRKLSLSEADGARLDFAESQIAEAVSDYKRQESSAARAADRGRSIGANLLVAQALYNQAEALERMGQTQKTVDLLDEAIKLYVASGNRRAAAVATLVKGDLYSDEGKYELAKSIYEGSLTLFRELGTTKSIRDTLERIGNVYYAEGKMRESTKYYEQTLQLDRDMNDLRALAGGYGNMANALDGLGDLQGSLKMQLLSLDEFNQVGDRRGSSSTLNNLGNVYAEMGDFVNARNSYDQSLNMTREINYKRGEPYPLSGQGDVLFAQGDLAGAGEKYKQALDLCKAMGDDEFGAQVTVGLANIALAEKRYSDGAPLAAQAAAAYEASNNAGNAAWGEAIRARNLVGGGDLSGAQAAAAKSISLATQSSSVTPPYEAAMADAAVKAAHGKAAEALKELEPVLASARKFGYKPYEYQMRLMIASIELHAGIPSAVVHLASVEKDARDHGSLLIANQAKALIAEHAAKDAKR